MEKLDLVKKELAPALQLSIPSRWVVTDLKASPKAVLAEIDRVCETLVSGQQALGGLYMRLCDLLRSHHVPPDVARPALLKYFPQPRVSEILRVANAPQEVYNRHSAGFFGFKALLNEARGLKITPTNELIRRKVVAAASRLGRLSGGKRMEVDILGFVITIEPKNLLTFAAQPDVDPAESVGRGRRAAAGSVVMEEAPSIPVEWDGRSRSEIDSTGVTGA